MDSAQPVGHQVNWKNEFHLHTLFLLYSWGEKGFIQIAKTSGNGLCALAGDATFPTF